MLSRMIGSEEVTLRCVVTVAESSVGGNEIF